MTQELVDYRMHASAQQVDMLENFGVPSSLRSQNYPQVDPPGLSPQDSLINPLTATAAYNPYRSPIVNDQDRTQWFEANPYTAGQQVQLFLNQSFGSSGNYKTPPMFAPGAYDTGASEWNSFDYTSSYRNIRDFGLSGRPNASKLRKIYDSDRIDPDFILKSKFAKNRPTSYDFEQSMHVAITPGAPGSFEPNYQCECRINSSRGIASIQAIAMSSANFEPLYKLMVYAKLLNPLERLVVYEGRSNPCLCSYITTVYAYAFNAFTQDMIQAAINEPDMRYTLNTINETFVDRLLGNIHASQERVKRLQYSRFMGRAAQFTLPPYDAYQSEGMPVDEWDESLKGLKATRYTHIDGAALFSNVNTAAAANQFSRPRVQQWWDDTYLLTGIDTRPQVEVAQTGAISDGLNPQVNIDKLADIIIKYKT